MKKITNFTKQVDEKFFSTLKYLLHIACVAIACILLTSISALADNTIPVERTTSNACGLPANIKNTPPMRNGKPVEVSVGVFLINVSELNELNENFKVDGAIHYYWNDPRLAERTTGRSYKECKFQISDIWSPTVGAINIIGKPSYWFESITVDVEGNVHHSARVQATLFSALNLQEFPFDTQELIIEFTSFAYDTNTVVIKQSTESTGRLEGIRIAGWELVNNFNNGTVKPLKALGNRERSRLNHVIVIKRKAAYYIWNYAVPLCLIVLMASSVFWIDPEAFGPQIGISTASVFTLVAFLLGLRQGLPQVSYLTRMDEMVLGATMLVFIFFAEVVYVSRLVHQEKAELARRIDWHARWIFITVFSILLFVILIKPNI